MENNNKNISCLEDLEVIKEYLDSLHGSKINYSDDIEGFNRTINELLQYVHMLLDDEKFHLIYLQRAQSIVYYGERVSGRRIQKGLINLVNEDGLKVIFDSVREEFKDVFYLNGKHTFGEGWSPLSTIDDKLMLDVESGESYDHNWFYEYTHKKEENSNKSK